MTWLNKRDHAIALVLLLQLPLSLDGFIISPFGTKFVAPVALRTQGTMHLSKKNEACSEEKEAAKGFMGQVSFEELPSTLVLKAQDALSPIARVMDDASDGWALSYADLSPESERSPIGQAFLATNIAYAIVGLILSINGDPFLGILTEVASIASFIYHYVQLQASNNRVQDSSVRFALLIDYICASTAILVGLVYLAMDHQVPPIEGIISGGAGIGCLLLCWVWEYGLPYIFLHSLWHLFSAYTAFVVGNAHLAVM